MRKDLVLLFLLAGIFAVAIAAVSWRMGRQHATLTLAQEATTSGIADLQSRVSTLENRLKLWGHLYKSAITLGSWFRGRLGL